MKFNWNQLGDWNPQLLREIKGRLKPGNLLSASVISLAGQLLLFLAAQTQLPFAAAVNNSFYVNRYCTGEVG